MVEAGGLTPPQSARTARLQRAAIVALPRFGNWGLERDSHPRPSPYEGVALTAAPTSQNDGALLRTPRINWTGPIDSSGRFCFLGLADRAALAVVASRDERDADDREPRDHEGNSIHVCCPFCLWGLAPQSFGRCVGCPHDMRTPTNWIIPFDD